MGSAADDFLIASDELRLLPSPGELAEWGTGDAQPAADEGHRHFSHLYALHPGHTLDGLEHPTHARAARRSLERRLRAGGAHVGWSAAWAVSLWARLFDGGRAHAALRYTLHEFASEALLGLHPKLVGKRAVGGGKCAPCATRATSATPGSGVFQLDANGGVVSGVAEMLLHSRPLTPNTPAAAAAPAAMCDLRLLPALPPAWTDGDVSGLRARGGWRVAMRWRAGRLRWAEIKEATPTDGDGWAPGRSGSAPLRVVLQGALRVCCSKPVCGSSAEDLSAAVGGATVHALEGGVGGGAWWAWEATPPWEMR